ncbi:MAG: YesL family protein [Brachybacterium sp.]|uniref:YesL family protein n=1 Tax=unclassified Brachybacterium TaxID=2623841 RepID=UPI003FD94FFB
MLTRLDGALHWLVRLVWLNTCWLGLTAAGGIVLGVGPATFAALEVAQRWMRGERDLPIGRAMWQQWRQGWRLTNAVTLLALTLCGALIVTWWLSRGLPPVPAALTQGPALLGLLLMVALMPHLLWIAGREVDGAPPRLAVVFTAALAVGLGRPVLTLCLLAPLIAWPMALIASGWPGLLPVCGISIPLVAAAWCLRRTFP